MKKLNAVANLLKENNIEFSYDQLEVVMIGRKMELIENFIQIKNSLDETFIVFEINEKLYQYEYNNNECYEVSLYDFKDLVERGV